MKFKVGDRVKVGGFQSMIRFRDDEGVIVGENPKYDSIGIEFDVAKPYMHDCDGRTSNGHGYWVREELITLIKPVKAETIVIYHNRKDNTVVAKNTATDEKAIAKCHPDDKFDFKTGAAIAFDRLLGREEPKEEYYNGKVVCVECSRQVDVTVGKIYDVVDGYLIDDWGDKRPCCSGIKPFKSLDELNEFGWTFIEVVE